MTNKEADFAIAGASCAGMLESMIEFNVIPAHHLDHAKRLVAEYNAAKKAWEDSTLIHMPLRGQA